MTATARPRTAHFSIKRGALGPVLESILSSAGVVQDLTGATVVFYLEHENGSPKITAAACTVVGPATDGRVRYGWQSGDTDIAGWFRAEFRITGLTGSPARWPSTGYIWVYIGDDVG